MTTISATKPEQPVGLYLLNLEVGNVGTPGAPILHVQALVNAPTGKITGHANITQALAPPSGDIQINDLAGEVHDLGVDPALTIANLSGTYQQEFPPPAIGEATLPFSATLVLPQGTEEGRGSFTYGGQIIKDVPVRVVPA